MKVELLNGNDIRRRSKIVAIAGRLSRFPGTIFKVSKKCTNFETNTKVIKNIINMGHKSIMEHDYLVFAISDVTPIIEQILIGFRLASDTVKSRREVDFSNVGYYTPNFSYLDNGDELTFIYQEHMNYLFKEYSNMLEKGISKEDARFILPYSYHSNMMMGMDVRTLEKVIDYCLHGKMSKVAEVRTFGLILLEIARENVPYLEDELNKQKDHSEDPFMFLDKMTGGLGSYKYDILDKPILIDYTEKTDNKILTSIIMSRYQVSVHRAELILENLYDIDKNIGNQLMKSLYDSKEQRELEQVNFQIQMSISLASLTHLTRHRMHSLVIPDFVPMWNLDKYITPESIASICPSEYHETYKKNREMYEYFKIQGVKEEDLVYFYLSGNMCNVLTTMNARTLMWISRMRCCNKAQWEIRDAMKSIVADVQKVAPLLGNYLGATCEVEGKCYEGKECCGKVLKLQRNK